MNYNENLRYICVLSRKKFIPGKDNRGKKLSWTYRNKKKRLGKPSNFENDDNVQVQNKKGRIIVRNLSFKVKRFKFLACSRFLNTWISNLFIKNAQIRSLKPMLGNFMNHLEKLKKSIYFDVQMENQLDVVLFSLKESWMHRKPFLTRTKKNSSVRWK